MKTTAKTRIPSGLLFSLLVSLLVSLLAACAAPTSTPAPAPTETALPPTATRLPTPTATPVPLALSGMDMLDETYGWAWAAKTDNTYALLRTQDGGQTWQDVTPGELPPLNIYGNVFLDSRTAWVQFFDAAANTSGLARTTDGGATWTVQNRDLTFPSAAFHFTDQDNGWAETVDVGAGNAYVQVFSTDDGGVTWKIVPMRGPTRETGLPAGTLHLCNICGDSFHYDPARLIVTYGDQATGPGGSVRLAISTDLGRHWNDLKLPLPSAEYEDDIIVPLAPVFFGLDDGILPVLMQNPDPNVPINALTFYHTQDGGISWRSTAATIDGVNASTMIDFASPADIFLACRNNLCVTHDAAQSWQVLPANLASDIHVPAPIGELILQFDFIDAQTGWAVAYNTDNNNEVILWKTTDGGQNWTRLFPTMAK